MLGRDRRIVELKNDGGVSRGFRPSYASAMPRRAFNATHAYVLAGNGMSRLWPGETPLHRLVPTKRVSYGGLAVPVKASAVPATPGTSGGIIGGEAMSTAGVDDGGDA